jgi:hypothetical protein
MALRHVQSPQICRQFQVSQKQPKEIDVANHKKIKIVIFVINSNHASLFLWNQQQIESKNVPKCQITFD